jgi:3-hydroxybutyryl-CoA dehydrogenase
MAGLCDADLVIEAVFEDLGAKAKLFAALDATLPAQAILASNTSTLSITRLAKVSNRPDRFVGLHFCLPAQLMKLVEVTPGLTTSEATLRRAEEFCRDTGQIGIRTQDTPGFVLNHFAIPLNNDAIRLVESGVAKPRDIDNAIRKAMGFPMGPLELVDLVGLDTQERLCDAFFEITRNPRHACPSLVRQMVAAGWLGKRAGRGFYELRQQGQPSERDAMAFKLIDTGGSRSFPPGHPVFASGPAGRRRSRRHRCRGRHSFSGSRGQSLESMPVRTNRAWH